jgi:hypothetical protein
LCVIVPTLNSPSSIGTPNQNVNYSISSPHHYLNGELIVKRISWTIIAALVATLFLPVSSAQAAVSSDASFTIKVNGQNVVDGATVNLPADTRTIEVTTITSQPTATVLYAEAYDEGNFNYEGPETCPTAGTCKRTMNTWRYVRNDSGVDTFKIEVTAPDLVTTLTKTFTVNQPFTKRIILKYVPNTVRYFPSNFFQEGLPGSGSGKPVLFPVDYEYGPYRTRFLTWSDGNTQNPRTDTFTKDVRVAGFWGLTPAPGKVSLDYFHDTRGTVTLVNSDGVDTFGDVGSPSFEQDGVSQQILRNTSGSSVRAVPNEGSRFLRWSDGSTANPRRDLNVASSFFVLAIFSEPGAAITAGPVANSQVATFSPSIKTAEIPATAALPAITLNFGGTAPTAVTVAPVASNPATPAKTPFKISASTKIVDITPTGTFTGSATICLDGGPTDSIFHFKNEKWVELPSRSYVNGKVCGVTDSFSPFTAAPVLAAPVVVYVPPTPVPYLKTLTNPQIHLVGDKFVCTAGTYNAGYTLDGVIQGSATALYTPASYTFNLLFNQVAQNPLAVTAAKSSAAWSVSSAPAGALVSCSVTVTANSLKNTDSSTANPAAVSAALTTQSQSASAAESTYNAAVSANSKSYQKALVDNRATWRANVDKVRTAYFAELTRINGLPYSKANSDLKSAALKTYLAAQKKTAVDYKASGPAALIVRDLANKAALDTKTAAIVKANSVYGTFIESIGYGVLIP